MNLTGFRLFHWLVVKLLAVGDSRVPDFIVKNERGDYLRRWWLIPRNPFFNLYLHHIVGDDDDRALHCHPWLNASLILRGGYREIVPISQAQSAALDYAPGFTYSLKRRAGDLVVRSGSTRHRLVSAPAHDCWTLFITGPQYRLILWLRTGCTWGFHCKSRFLGWKKFVSARDKGVIGAGCGD